MLGVLVLAHGNLGEGIASSVNMLIGGDPLPFCSLDENGLEMFEKKVFQKLDEMLNAHEGVLVFCDLKGGTPANTALKYKLMTEKNIEIISGVNVPMLLEVLLDLENLSTISDALSLALETGKESIDRINI